MIKTCKICNKEFRTYQSRILVGKGIFCSQSCSNSFTSMENKRAVGSKSWTGKTHSEASKELISKSKKGQRASIKTEFKPGKSPWNKGIKRLDISGENHPNWRGGITKEHIKVRNSLEYKQWRKQVFERDNYTCVCCKRKNEVSGKLQAHHIKPFSLYPELRLSVENGRTLCEDCHKQTDTYLWKISTKNKKVA